jgi:hypothetical protein
MYFATKFKVKVFDPWLLCGKTVVIFKAKRADMKDNGL